jgi:phosphoribosylanthranilate isomerase
MATKVKICGVTRLEDAEMALSLGADYIGINVFKNSPRAVSLDRVPELLEAIPQGKRVVVDVLTDPIRLSEYKSLGFDYFQIHFDLNLSMATLSAWTQVTGADALWMAPRIPPGEVPFPQILMEFGDTILLDTFHKDVYGGTGVAGQNWQRFLDWTVLYQHKKWVLAGGLNPGNIVEALSFTEAVTVDVASGVEASPGIKDPA